MTKLNDTTKFTYTKAPGIWGSYLKIISVRRKGLESGGMIPNLVGELLGFNIDKEHLNRYSEICGLEKNSKMPILYPHVIASSIYMNMLTHKLFPFGLVGSLHLRNHIIQHRQINIDGTFDIKVEVIEQRVVKQGMEFDFTISILIDKERVWESISTWLTRGKFGKEYENSPNAEILKTEPEAKHFADLYIPKNIGKKFAKITLDYNPIHISRILASLFGLKRDVAHAMWASGNALGKLSDVIYDKPTRIDLAFKGPLFLDSKSNVKTIEKDKNLLFDYYCGDNDRPSINGRVSNVEQGAKLF
jgi:MaoC like domain